MATNSKVKTDIYYSLKSISIVTQRVNEATSFDISDPSNIIVEFNGGVNLINDEFIIEAILSYKFLYKENELFFIEISNKFSIQKTNNAGLLRVYQNQHFIKHLINISTHHFRGMQSILLKNSKFSSLFIPINNPYDLKTSSDNPSVEHSH